jgi:hypothetical protein
MDYYVVKKEVHLGPLRRKLKLDSVLEWEPNTETLKIDGIKVENSGGVNPSEAMSMLLRLRSINPDNSPIDILPEISHNTNNELKTSSLCVLPVLGCLSAASNQLIEHYGICPSLKPVNEQQSQFIELFGDLLSEVGSIKEIESIADINVSVVNSWLQKRGFTIALTEQKDFSVASIFDVMLHWLNNGVRTSIVSSSGCEYTGVKMDNGVTVSYTPAIHSYPVARISTKSGDVVCMSMVDDIPDGISGLFIKAADLEKVKSQSHQHKGVSFPMVDLLLNSDISWFYGFDLGCGYRIGQALQQTKFKMNEKGARVSSAASMNIYRRSLVFEKPYIIDRPFLLWIKREGFDFPVFASLLCEDVWKEPVS